MDNKDQDVIREAIKEEENTTPINYTRKIMELREGLDSRLNNIVEWYGKQVELDKNNDDQLIVIDRLQKTEFEYNEKRAKVIKEYMDKASKIVPDRMGESGSNMIYFKARYIGDVKKYEKILCGMDYYLHLKVDGNIDIYNDAKFSKYLTRIEYIPTEWQSLIVDII